MCLTTPMSDGFSRQVSELGDPSPSVDEFCVSATQKTLLTI